MDLISGIVIVSSVFLISLALAALFSSLAAKEVVKMGRDGGIGHVDMLEWMVASRSRVIFASLFVVYTIVMTDIFVIAQQTTLAFINFVVGVALVAVQFIAVSPRGSRRKTSDDGGGVDPKGPGS